MSMFYVDTEI